MEVLGDELGGGQWAGPGTRSQARLELGVTAPTCTRLQLSCLERGSRGLRKSQAKGKRHFPTPIGDLSSDKCFPMLRNKPLQMRGQMATSMRPVLGAVVIREGTLVNWGGMPLLKVALLSTWSLTCAGLKLPGFLIFQKYKVRF